jgi:hypothetical protein
MQDLKQSPRHSPQATQCAEAAVRPRPCCITGCCAYCADSAADCRCLPRVPRALPAGAPPPPGCARTAAGRTYPQAHSALLAATGEGSFYQALQAKQAAYESTGRAFGSDIQIVQGVVRFASISFNTSLPLRTDSLTLKQLRALKESWQVLDRQLTVTACPRA